MWDRFKKWKKDSSEKNICPLCQYNNSPKSETCSSCSYELNKPNYQQTSNLEESETNNLFNELMNKASKDANDFAMLAANLIGDQLKEYQKKMIWSQCKTCHDKFRMPH